MSSQSCEVRTFKMINVFFFSTRYFGDTSFDVIPKMSNLFVYIFVAVVCFSNQLQQDVSFKCEIGMIYHIENIFCHTVL